MAVKSSCIDLCVFDGKTGWCEGCGRTRQETQAWRKLSPYHRKETERALPLRLKTLHNKK
jgi:predicted Fe-S protein YdhL (DUF1289 family)